MWKTSNAKNLELQFHGIVGVLVVAVSYFLLDSRCSATVLTFDDLTAGYTLTGSSYGGVTWEFGNGGSGGHLGEWIVPTTGSNPHSAPGNAINAFGSTLMGISFPSPVAASGAYIAVQGNGGWAQGLRIHGYLAGQEVIVTPYFQPLSTTPAWFDMNQLTNVDRIVFDAPASFENQAYYGIDDLTFTPLPEPTSLGIVSIAGLSLLSFRRQRTEKVIHHR